MKTGAQLAISRLAKAIFIGNLFFLSDLVHHRSGCFHLRWTFRNQWLFSRHLHFPPPPFVAGRGIKRKKEGRQLHPPCRTTLLCPKRFHTKKGEAASTTQSLKYILKEPEIGFPPPFFSFVLASSVGEFTRVQTASMLSAPIGSARQKARKTGNQTS